MANVGKNKSNLFGFNFDVYEVISWMGLMFTPIAPAGFFGVRVYGVLFVLSSEAMSAGASLWFSGIVSFLFAVALECIGIITGHLTMQIWQDFINGKKGRIPLGVLSVVVLICYVLLGLYELKELPTGQMAFLMAPLMYITKGVHIVQKKWQAEEEAEQERLAQKRQTEQAQNAESWQAEQTKKRQADELEYRRKQLELERQDKEAETQRQLAIANAKWEHEHQLKKIELEAKQAKRTGRNGAQLANNMPQVASANVYQYTDWRTVPEDIKKLVAEMTPEEIGRTFPNLAERTCREWRKKARQFVGKE